MAHALVVFRSNCLTCGALEMRGLPEKVAVEHQTQASLELVGRASIAKIVDKQWFKAPHLRLR